MPVLKEMSVSLDLRLLPSKRFIVAAAERTYRGLLDCQKCVSVVVVFG